MLSWAYKWVHVAFESQNNTKAQEHVATLIHIHSCRKRAFYFTEQDVLGIIFS